MRITSDQNEYEFSKQLRPVNISYKRLYLRRFLESFVNFYITTASETFCQLSTSFWMTASRFFFIEQAFCERDKNHKFDNFKTILC